METATETQTEEWCMSGTCSLNGIRHKKGTCHPR